MARRPQAPRVTSGSTVYRVEWTEDVPAVVQYKVTAATPNSLQLSCDDGSIEVSGAEELQLIAASWNDAIDRAFVLISDAVARRKTDSLTELRKTEQLALLLKS